MAEVEGPWPKAYLILGVKAAWVRIARMSTYYGKEYSQPALPDGWPLVTAGK